MDETWNNPFTPESNWQSAKRRADGESRLKRTETQTLAGKVFTSVFWDARGILLIVYVDKRRTIKIEYYISLLVRLKEEIKKEKEKMRPQMKKKDKFSFTKTMQRVICRSQRR